MTSASEQGIRDRLRALPVFDRELPVFDANGAAQHPAEQFAAWLGEAIDAGVPEPHAMTLSTVDADGGPNARMLILKGLHDGAWQFATSNVSRKATALASSRTRSSSGRPSASVGPCACNT